MRAEDVPPEWVARAMDAFARADGAEIAHIIAAVAPLIAAAERERCIATTRNALNAYGRWNGAITSDTLMAKIEPAIRALGDAAFVVATDEPDGSIKMRHEGDV